MQPTIRLEAENYKSGSDGVAYHDNTYSNSGGRYRSDGVDISATPNASGGYLVSWTEAGEWLTYDVNVPTTGVYNVVTRVASMSNTPMSIGVSLGGQRRTSNFSSTGGWTAWQDVKYEKVSLSAGQQTLRLDVLAGGFNLDYIELIPVEAPSPTVLPPTFNLGKVINGRTSSKIYTGSDGIDTINYSQATSAIIANLGTGVVTHKFATSVQKPLKIMPTGDSSTFGLEKLGDSGAYRDDLWKLLTGNGFNVDFVGPQSTGPSGFDKDHAGYPGWTINNIAGSVNGWLSTGQPDIVLLMIGTNDILTKENISSAPARLSNLIDQITSKSPNAQVLVASIPPTSRQDPDAEVDFRAAAIEFNSKIPGIVNTKTSAGKNVSFVDVYSGLSESDLADQVHPTTSGNNKIAKTWYDAILKTNSGTDTLNKIENVIGSQYNDTLIGSGGDNIINGGGGDDLLTGGGGRDIFVLTPGQGKDRITDFVVGQDWLGLSTGLKFEQLVITRGTGTNINDTTISYNSQQLALVSGVQANTITSNVFIPA